MPIVSFQQLSTAKFLCDVTTPTPRKLRESLGVESEPRKEYFYYSEIGQSRTERVAMPLVAQSLWPNNIVNFFESPETV